MLSGKLIELIQRNSDQLAERVIQKIHRNPAMPVLAERSDHELRVWCGHILGDLGSLLAGEHPEDTRQGFRAAGQQRFEEGVPLHEAVLRFQILRNTIAQFLDEHILPVDSLHLYAAEEVERGLSRLFDSLVYSLVVGYEKALRGGISRAA